MIRRLALAFAALVLLDALAFWFLTRPTVFPAAALPDHAPDLANGELMFNAGGCASCHAAPGSGGEDRRHLAGGLALTTPFGKFVAPNISPDRQHGIGGWTLADFVTSMKYGVDPAGRHLYPAFPYNSYQRMRVEDMIDLKAYLDTLPPVAASPPGHEIPFPYSFRRGIGLWKLAYIDGKTFEPDPALDARHNRGAYLVLGPGHCGECHSPRNAFGGIVAARAFSGGPAPEGEGHIPNITPDPDSGIGDWSEEEIAEALSTGFKPDFDSFGSSMVDVQENLARLPPDDVAAIAAYLKSLPPVSSAGG